MKLVCSTYSTDENYSGDCNYALVDLTPELANYLLTKIKLFEQLYVVDDNLTELQYWNRNLVFFANLPEEEPDIDDSFNEVSFSIPDDQVESLELERLHVDADGVYWSAVPNHCRMIVESRIIEVELLQRIANEPCQNLT